MDLSRVPKYVWWIITPTILLPVGFLMTALGVLIITYACMLPNAKGITIDTPYLKIVSEFASQQIAINNDMQKIITEATTSIQQLSSSPSPASTPIMMNSKQHNADVISKINSQAGLLEFKRQQLEKINHELLHVEETIKMLQPKNGI